jgi:hypothetical protein
MALDLEIRRRVVSYLAGNQSLREFEDWFVPEAWSGVESQDHASLELIPRIELTLAEHSNGHLSEGDLREDLSKAIEFYRSEMTFSGETGATHSTTGSNAPLQRLAMALG